MDPGGNQGRPANWTARILAPLALIVATVVVISVVVGSVGGSDEDGKRERTERAETGCQPSSEGEAARSDGYYVVQPGEPGLSSVADKTCIPIEQLQELNENLDPQLIPQGACVDLRPDGCKALAAG